MAEVLLRFERLCLNGFVLFWLANGFLVLVCVGSHGNGRFDFRFLFVCVLTATVVSFCNGCDVLVCFRTALFVSLADVCDALMCVCVCSIGIVSVSF